MKKLVILLMVGAAFGLLSGCSLNDDEYAMRDVWVGFGIVQKGDSYQTSKISMDDGEILYPVTSSGFWHEVSDNERVLVNFTITGNKDNAAHNEEYYVTINSFRKVLYKGILDITPAKEDSIGNDPVQVKDHWLKGNMLNFELQYWGGDKVHYLNLVKQPGAPANGVEPVVLELRHNTNGDTEHLPLSGMVTFDLGALKVAGKDSISFKVVAKKFDGTNFEFTGVYKY